MKKLFYHLQSGKVTLKCTVIIAAVILLSACSPKKPVKQTQFMLDTICSITVYGTDNNKTADEAINEAFELCSKYEKLLSRTIKDSDVYKINSSNGQEVAVSDDTAELLGIADYYSRLTDGAFDITTAPLSLKWDFNAENPCVPTEDEIAELIEKVDYEKVNVEGNMVSLKSPVEAIDLGAIAKGYIADKLADNLRKNGVTSAVITLGGNIYAIGINEIEKRPFNLGVQDPKSLEGDIVGYVSASDKSLVTSGDYQRYFEENGVRYHHLLNPDTGYPAETGLSSVTIISDRSVDGDALSTACFVMGKERGMELINRINDVEAIFIDDDNELYFSDGFDDKLEFIKSEG